MLVKLQNELNRVTAMIALALTLAFAAATQARQDRPEPQRPTSQSSTSAGPDGSPVVRGDAPQSRASSGSQPGTDSQPGRNSNEELVRKHEVPPGKITLAINDAPVDEKIVGFIAENTGKVVIPINLTLLKSKKITVMHDEPIERAAALDLVLTALRLNGVGISETDEYIVLDDIQVMKQRTAPVYTSHDDIMHLKAEGNFIVKIYRLKEASAENVNALLVDNIPDYATLTADANSNQIILYGDVATAQHIQHMIDELDYNNIVVKTETFRLAYADATALSQQILDLFENTGTTQNQPGAPRPQRLPNQRGGRGGNAPGSVPATPASAGTPGPVVELRVSVNVQQNTVTVSAEPKTVMAIAKLINEQWDLPRPKETFRVYVLQHTDPIKMRDLITNLMGGGSGSSSRTQGARAGAGGIQRVTQPGAAGQGGISEAIGDIYRVEAYPDRNSIIVLSKTKEALDYLDAFIEANDQPSYVGLPQIVELKHANAVNLADELNALLAEAGTAPSLIRPGTGLTAEGPGGFDDNGNGTSGTSGTAGRTGAAGANGTGGSTIELPWQRSRPRDDQTDPSPLIGKVRIVPIVRQNALAILAPIPQRQSIAELVREFDKPGRQVMISAIIAEVQLNNDFAFGLRVSSSAITPTNSDNALTGSLNLMGTTNNVASKLFDTSVLDASVDVNVLIQALSQKTNVRIIQEPRVFTADNEEAAFFDGQQIPFITNSVVNSQVNGGVTQSFDYKKVGVLLNVRPRITVQRDVDMEIRLALSAVVPGQTLFGGAILDLRETTTKVIVKNAQTIVLSGLMKDLDSKVSRGLPLLSDIPLIGDLFKSHDNSKATSELVAFITPIVVDNPTENDTNFNQEERENLREWSKPTKNSGGAISKEREKIRDKMLAPKTQQGVPVPEDLPEDDHKDSMPPARPAPAPPVPAGQSVPTTQPGDQNQHPPATPPVDIDELPGASSP